VRAAHSQTQGRQKGAAATAGCQCMLRGTEWSAYLRRPYAILIASSSVADVGQSQECAGQPACVLLPPPAVRV
jgi:hypothetical protein